MASANDVIDGANRLLDIIASGESATDAEAQDALTALNDMLHGFEFEGVNLGHTTLALTDTVNLPASHIEGLKYMLALKIAPQFDVPPSPLVVVEAARAKRLFQSVYKPVAALALDSALLRMPSQYWGERN